MAQEFIVCGDNSNLLLNEYSNGVSAFRSPVISPPLNSPLDLSSILCYSIYYDHMVFITNDNRAYAIGDNRDFRISSTLPKEKLFSKTDILIKDNDNNDVQYIPISVVCGCKYTLYLVSTPNNTNLHHLIYSSKESKKTELLQIGNRNPISLYGGRTDSAAIDSEGGIIYISGRTNKVFNSNLPSSEKAVYIACCDKFIFALSKSGRLFQSFSGDELEFSEVSELSHVEIVSLSGSWFHCLAVSKDGKVFGYGENYCGQIGLGKEIGEIDKFKEIEKLRNCNVKSVYAGGTHSLFQTDDGKILACGCNFHGQLLFQKGPTKEKIFTPCETTVKNGALFCVVGDGISAVFFKNVPKNCPNMICSLL